MAYSKTFDDSVVCPLTVSYSVTTRNLTRLVKATGSRSGERVPNWKEKIRLGSDATSPFTSDRWKLVSSTPLSLKVVGRGKPPNQSFTSPQSVSGFQTAFNMSGAHIVESASEANAIALATIYKKMNSQITHVSVPAAFLELADVIRQFGSPMRAILRLTESHLNRLYLQRRGITALKYNKKQWTKILADTYLEYAFGLAPLINDTKGVAEALARLTYELEAEKPFKQKLIGRGSTTKSSSAQSIVMPSNTQLVFNSTNRKVTETRVQYVAGFSAYPTADLGSQQRLMQLLGFRPESWIPAVWEAVPWSWLVDYFTNVQDILTSVEASVIKPSWISKTVSTVTDFTTAETFDLGLTTSVFGSNSMNIDRVSGNQGSLHQSRRTTVVRTKPAQLGFPNVYFRLPTSVKQLGNMAAAVTTLRKSTPNISLETNYRSFLR